MPLARWQPIHDGISWIQYSGVPATENIEKSTLRSREPPELVGSSPTRISLCGRTPPPLPPPFDILSWCLPITQQIFHSCSSSTAKFRNLYRHAIKISNQSIAIKLLISLFSFAVATVAAKPRFLNSNLDIQHSSPFDLKFGGCGSGCSIFLQTGDILVMKNVWTLANMPPLQVRYVRPANITQLLLRADLCQSPLRT